MLSSELGSTMGELAVLIVGVIYLDNYYETCLVSLNMLFIRILWWPRGLRYPLLMNESVGAKPTNGKYQGDS